MLELTTALSGTLTCRGCPWGAGRKGKTGIATTFINKNQSEQILLDLKHLLKEAKQRVPPVLQALHDPMDELAVRGACCWGVAAEWLMLRCGVWRWRAAATRSSSFSSVCTALEVLRACHPAAFCNLDAGDGGHQRHQGLRVLRRPGPPSHRLPQAAGRHAGAEQEAAGPVWRRNREL